MQMRDLEHHLAEITAEDGSLGYRECKVYVRLPDGTCYPYKGMTRIDADTVYIEATERAQVCNTCKDKGFVDYFGKKVRCPTCIQKALPKDWRDHE